METCEIFYWYSVSNRRQKEIWQLSRVVFFNVMMWALCLECILWVCVRMCFVWMCGWFNWIINMVLLRSHLSVLQLLCNDIHENHWPSQLVNNLTNGATPTFAVCIFFWSYFLGGWDVILKKKFFPSLWLLVKKTQIPGPISMYVLVNE